MINEVVTRLKNNDIQIPLWLGQLISNIPYSVRPIVGKYYRIRREELRRYKSYSIGERQMFIFNRMYKIVKYSLEYISFYKKFYADQGFSLDCLKSFEDIDKIPIINNKDSTSIFIG